MLRTCLFQCANPWTASFEELWSHQLPDPTGLLGPLVPITQMRTWLQPRDLLVQTVYASILADRSIQEEFTCEWFSGSLFEFIRSSDTFFWIEAHPDAAKALYLAGRQQLCNSQFLVGDISSSPTLLIARFPPKQPSLHWLRHFYANFLSTKLASAACTVRFLI